MVGKSFVLAVLLFVLFVSSSCFALDVNKLDANSSPVKDLSVFVASQSAVDAKSLLDGLDASVSDMNAKGFGTARVSDEVFVAKQLYENSLNREKQKLSADYSQVRLKIDSASALIALAYQASDELAAFKLTVASADKSLDLNTVNSTLALAQQEFNDQRYEKVIDLVNAGYEQLNELQSLQAKANAAYEAARKNLEGFLFDNWQIILGVIVVVVVLFLGLRKRVKKYFLVREIGANDAEIGVLKDEIKRAQEKYFVEGNLAESEYGIKMNIYSEKIRDLNRVNALCTEELEKLKGMKGLSFKPKDGPKIR